MKSAVVFGARQRYGYEICAKLLEYGCVVYAIDHEKWQTEENEDRWMGIGRNSHLDLTILGREEKSAAKIEFSINPVIYIIPVFDYNAYKFDEIHDQLILMLEHLSKPRKGNEPLFVFFQTSASERNQSEFQQKLGLLIEQIRGNQQQIIQYFLPSSHSHIFFLKNDDKNVREILYKSDEGAIDIMIDHLMQQKNC